MSAVGPNGIGPGGDGALPFRTIDAGVVAHNDQDRIERSVRSLLGQELPAGTRWGRIWLVASGCTDRTAEIARALVREDGRIRLVVEPERRGKAAAIREILCRADGDAVVLLNSDAVARAGAVTALLEKGAGKSGPYAVMARPVVTGAPAGGWSRTLEWMWDLHHEYHLDLLADGRGTHLSDELLLLGGPTFPPLPAGVINDGSYLAVWLRQHGGGCWYAPEALVEIDIPLTRSDHLRQRRRIHVGNAQVARLLGSPPSTLPRRLGRRPVATARTVIRLARRPGGVRHLARIVAGELVSHTLAVWDRLPPARDHVRWQRIGNAGRRRADPGGAVEARFTGAAPLEARIRALLETSELFATGLRLDDLVSLLPTDAPTTAEEARIWFRAHPNVGRVEGDLVFSPASFPRDLPARRERGAQYRHAARLLVDHELSPATPWLRCVAVSGSTAYGEPDEGDDLDLFVVTRAGALWYSLARTYLALRFGGGSSRRPGDPPVCLNYVLDDHSAPIEFLRRRDFHVAREALTSEVVLGGRYYRSLLGSANWMAQEIPRLYAQRVRDAGSPASEPAPIGIRVLNAIAFPILATYLQLVGLRRNRKLWREGRSEEIFRTTTRWRQLAFTSRRFDSLRDRHRVPGPRSEPGPPPGERRVEAPRRRFGYPRRAKPDVP